MNSKIEQILGNLRCDITGHEKDIEKYRKEILELEQTIDRIRNNIGNSNTHISILKNAIKTINRGIESFHDKARAMDEIKIQAKIKSLTDDEFVEFDGDDNCIDECRGWNGKDKRCDCGNRRLCWRVDNDEVYPEAL